jgi:hypothetical protein
MEEMEAQLEAAPSFAELVKELVAVITEENRIMAITVV